MCPFSGLMQFLILLVTFLLICHAVVVKSVKANFKPNSTTLNMYDSVLVSYDLSEAQDSEYYMYAGDPNVAYLSTEFTISKQLDNLKGAFNITGNFLGKTVITCANKKTKEKCEDNVDVIVVRKKRIIDTVFTASVAMLVSILYINFGCAVDWGQLRDILKKPIGPAIGFFCQFVGMPLISYAVGTIIFPDNHEMQLGMFFTGVSPAGGASNVWAVVLDGNMNLSIIMTTISTVAAFAMMPLWIFTLGRSIFINANLEVPYSQISTYVVSLIIPLALGYLIQKYLPKVAAFMKRIIKGFSTCLIIFIVVFAIVTNLYLFKLFSWQIIVAGMALPWIGYIIGYLLSMASKQSHPDCLTIAIETGIQNTGIAIFLLRFALPQPEADLTTVAPVSVAILTPFPLMFLYFYKKIKTRFYHSHCKLKCNEENFKTDNNFNGTVSIGDNRPVF